MVQPPKTHGRQRSRAEDYLRKVTILKQIMSNKARKFRAVNASQNIATVAVSSFLLFFGFSGLDKITLYISWIHHVDRQVVELWFNLLVFLLFVIGVLHLVFRFSEKQASAERAVTSLAALANEIEDMITSKGNLVISQEPGRIDLIRARYESIVESIPANSDREFLRAKRDLAQKDSRLPTLFITPEQMFDQYRQEQIVSSIVLGSREIVEVLLALRDTDEALYLGGGMIRNAVWDYLHGYLSPTMVDDVDIIHFDPERVEKRHDVIIQTRLEAKAPNAKWSVKNQARMHTSNNEPPYTSLEDAVSHWPETATAFIARLDATGTVKFVAPYGFDDLLRLLIRNTPAFSTRAEIIRHRIIDKQWLRLWPRLKVILPAGS